MKDDLNLQEELDQEATHLFRQLKSGPIQATTIGYMTGGHDGEHQRHDGSVPAGCQWSPDCENCPWDDCAVKYGSAPAYDAVRAKECREQFVQAVRLGALSLKAAAARLGTSQESVLKYVKDYDLPVSEQAEKLMQVYAMGQCSQRKLAPFLGVAQSTLSRRFTKMDGFPKQIKMQRNERILQLLNEGLTAPVVADA